MKSEWMWPKQVFIQPATNYVPYTYIISYMYATDKMDGEQKN